MFEVWVEDIDPDSADYGRQRFWAEFDSKETAQDYVDQLKRWEIDWPHQTAYVVECDHRLGSR